MVWAKAHVNIGIYFDKYLINLFLSIKFDILPLAKTMLNVSSRLLEPLFIYPVG